MDWRNEEKEEEKGYRGEIYCECGATISYTIGLNEKFKRYDDHINKSKQHKIYVKKHNL